MRTTASHSGCDVPGPGYIRGACWAAQGGTLHLAARSARGDRELSQGARRAPRRSLRRARRIRWPRRAPVASSRDQSHRIWHLPGPRGLAGRSLQPLLARWLTTNASPRRAAAAVQEGFDVPTEGGRLGVRIMLALAQFDFERTSAAWRSACEHAISRGLYFGGTSGLGYRVAHPPARATGDPHPTWKPPNQRYPTLLSGLSRCASGCL